MGRVGGRDIINVSLGDMSVRQWVPSAVTACTLQPSFPSMCSHSSSPAYGVSKSEFGRAQSPVSKFPYPKFPKFSGIHIVVEEAT